MTEKELIQKEVNFLNAVGVDLSNGFTSEDVKVAKQEHPSDYHYYVVLG